jgi:hypothetical protein
LRTHLRRHDLASGARLVSALFFPPPVRVPNGVTVVRGRCQWQGQYKWGKRHIPEGLDVGEEVSSWIGRDFGGAESEARS